MRELSREVTLRVVVATVQELPTVTLHVQLSQAVSEVVRMVGREVNSDPDDIFGLYLVARQAWLPDQRHLKELNIDADVRGDDHVPVPPRLWPASCARLRASEPRGRAARSRPSPLSAGPFQTKLEYRCRYRMFKIKINAAPTAPASPVHADPAVAVGDLVSILTMSERDLEQSTYGLAYEWHEAIAPDVKLHQLVPHVRRPPAPARAITPAPPFATRAITPAPPFATRAAEERRRPLTAAPKPTSVRAGGALAKR